MGLLTRRAPAPPAPRRPPTDRQCTGTTKAGNSCTQWARKGESTCRGHGPRDTRPDGEQSNTRGSMVAASAFVKMSGVSWKEWRFGDREWQTEGWRLYDITGQLRYVANSVANSLSLCSLYVTELDEAGHEIGETEDLAVSALAAVPLGTGDAQAEAVRLAGLNLFVPGEVYIVAEAGGRDDGEDLWFTVSARKVTKQGSDITIKRPMLHGGGDMIYREDEGDRLIRVWTPHGADSDEPDSPTRSALPDLRELETIRKREFAELDSRLAGAGILFVPKGIDFPERPAEEGEEQLTGLEQFQKDLQEAMATSIQDRASASAMVPITVEVDADMIEAIRHMTFWSDVSDQLLPLKESALKGLAQSLDAPPEMMTGMADANHWAAWWIEENTIKTHYEPLLSRLADALTQGYLVDALTAIGRDPAKYAYRFSTAALRVRADRSKDALELWDKDLLDDETAIEAADFDIDNMPTGEERKRRMAERAFRENPEFALSDPELRALLGFTGSPPPATGQDQEPIRVESEPVEPRALPEQADDPPGQDTAGLVAACELAVLRALELAGGRLVPHRNRGTVPRHQLHTIVGAADRATADRALVDAWEHVPLLATAWGLPAGELRDLLHGYVVELLTHKAEHNRGLLAALLVMAVRRA